MYFEETNGIQMGAGVKVVIYGQEGVGKSSLAAKFPGAVFIDCEGSTSKMNVRRLPKPTSWSMLNEELNYILEVHREKGYRSVIVDTFDWAERLVIDELCSEHNISGIEGMGYGKGWQYEAEKIGRFLDSTERLINAGINVILNCHAISRKTTLPEEMDEFDHWELKLGNKTTNKIAPLLKEWSDMTLFLAFHTNVVATDDKGKKHKATSVQRVMYTTKTAWWDAKNRFGLPERMPLDWSGISGIFEIPPEKQAAHQVIEKAQKLEIPVQEEISDSASDSLDGFVEILTAETETPYHRVLGIPDKLADLMAADKITAEEVQTACSDIKHHMPKGMPLQDYPEDYINGCLIGAWQQVKETIMTSVRSNVPF